MTDNPDIHIGIISRNFTPHPGNTIRQVLAGAKKINILEAMKVSLFKNGIFAADEISDYLAAYETGYNPILMAS